ncbi:MAG: malto-oligosyltrehalose trehalohydrolase [Candidatus Omnitrophica bacterium]|nr:malto-oligosyltrehalose trehalohydrolase [Candidatus Omnitrophota bacterium]MBD3269368.1 malto-oligosyltrehalose trehalohydrolase [Candidatus Omnitrophota bacterium]
MNIGAYLNNKKCEFCLWAPFLNKVELNIISPWEKIVPMGRQEGGYWQAEVEGVSEGVRYLYILEGKTSRPDPASFYQPEGVHGPSCVINHNSFDWTDSRWEGIDSKDMIIYEAHTGTFTPEGTFVSLAERLDYLKDLGINTLEIMPVAQFPGERNWGYDGVYPFAVQHSYGGPDGLKSLVNACHSKNIAVILDVVYNHLGPEGNYLRDYGPYFTDKYKTFWGQALNFDGAYSDAVKDYFVRNAIYWLENYHFDALRLDAVHSIFDMSAQHFLKVLSHRVKDFFREKKRRVYLIAESDLNDSRIIRSCEQGGFAIDAQWCDDFHHALFSSLTGEREGYYADFGNVGQIASSIENGFVYEGQYSVYRKRSQGNFCRDISPSKFIVFSQNHDQIGNRMLGERLSKLVDFRALKTAAAAVILSPHIPLLFMGEEYAEDSPFLYFIDHHDRDLIEAVRRGRKEEFKSFNWKGEVPDPQSKDTFAKSRLKWQCLHKDHHRILRDFYKELINLRKSCDFFKNPRKELFSVTCFDSEKVIMVCLKNTENSAFYLLNFSDRTEGIKLHLEESSYSKLLDSSDKIWAGRGSGLPALLKGNEQIFLEAFNVAVYKTEV